MMGSHQNTEDIFLYLIYSGYGKKSSMNFQAFVNQFSNLPGELFITPWGINFWLNL
jgi:hypothetical protein